MSEIKSEAAFTEDNTIVMTTQRLALLEGRAFMKLG